MTVPPKKKVIVKTPISKAKIFDPGLVFYRPAVREVLASGELTRINGLIKAAKELQAEFGDFGGLITQLESAARKAR